MLVRSGLSKAADLVALLMNGLVQSVDLFLGAFCLCAGLGEPAFEFTSLGFELLSREPKLLEPGVRAFGLLAGSCTICLQFVTNSSRDGMLQLQSLVVETNSPGVDGGCGCTRSAESSLTPWMCWRVLPEAHMFGP